MSENCSLLLCIAILSYILSGLAALADDEALMQSALESKICRPDAAEFHDPSYEDMCGQDYQTVMSSFDIIQCQQKTDRIRALIYKYNEFVRECKEKKRSKVIESKSKALEEWNKNIQKAESNKTAARESGGQALNAAGQRQRAAIKSDEDDSEKKQAEDLQKKVLANQRKIREQMANESCRKVPSCDWYQDGVCLHPVLTYPNSPECKRAGLSGY